jgi:hypothetical protein
MCTVGFNLGINGDQPCYESTLWCHDYSLAVTGDHVCYESMVS